MYLYAHFPYIESTIVVCHFHFNLGTVVLHLTADFTTDLGFNPGTFYGVGAKPANTFMQYQSLGYFEWIQTADLMNYPYHIHIP